MDSLNVARFEYKYLITAGQAPQIRDWLLRYTVQDKYSHGADWYRITNLYLDSGVFKLYHDTIEKEPFRFKLRLRCYGSNTGPAKVEVKRRERDVIRKTSAVVAPDLIAGGLPGLWDSGLPALRGFLQLAESERATPRVLVNYERQAFFSSVDDYVRVTFDRRMLCQPMLNWSLEGHPRLWRPFDNPMKSGERESGVVLELKFSNRAPAWLGDLTRRFGLVRHGFSKYARAVDRVVADNEPAWDLRTNAWARRVA